MHNTPTLYDKAFFMTKCMHFGVLRLLVLNKPIYFKLALNWPHCTKRGTCTIYAKSLHHKAQSMHICTLWCATVQLCLRYMYTCIYCEFTPFQRCKWAFMVMPKKCVNIAISKMTITIEYGI